MRERLAAGQDVNGLVIRALEQTGGRGRRGSTWLSDRGGSFQTAAVRDHEDAAPGGPQATFLTLALAIGIAQELIAAGAQVRVKWPNDLMLGERKLGGLLVERTAGHVLIGVGVNVANPVPDAFASLRGWDPLSVGDLVLDGLVAGFALMSGTAAAAVDAFAGLDWLAGRLTTVEVPGGSFSGVAAGVDEVGCLQLASDETPQGRTRVCLGHVVNASSEPRGTN